MKQTRYNNLIQLTRMFSVNCYFVIEDDGLTVIDTNISGSADGIVAAAQSLGQPVRRIVLTHAHNDHVASADSLKAQLADAELITSARTRDFLAGKMDLMSDEPQSPLKGGYMQIDSTPDRIVKEGEMIGSLRVVAAPGHTPGQIALLDTRDDTLIAGDAFQTLMGLAVMGKFKLLFPFPAMATWDKPTALHTAQKLRVLNPSRLAVGHGRVLENPGAAMDVAIAEAARAFKMAVPAL